MPTPARLLRSIEVITEKEVMNIHMWDEDDFVMTAQQIAQLLSDMVEEGDLTWLGFTEDGKPLLTTKE